MGSAGGDPAIEGGGGAAVVERVERGGRAIRGCGDGADGEEFKVGVLQT
jgi:hypothetical protein